MPHFFGHVFLSLLSEEHICPRKLSILLMECCWGLLIELPFFLLIGKLGATKTIFYLRVIDPNWWWLIGLRLKVVLVSIDRSYERLMDLVFLFFFRFFSFSDFLSYIMCFFICFVKTLYVSWLSGDLGHKPLHNFLFLFCLHYVMWKLVYIYVISLVWKR